MNCFHVLGFSRARLFGIRLLSVATTLMVALASFVVGFIPAAAQMEFDFNDDGSVTCEDFREEFPDTFTDEATEALRQYPDDLSDLNRDSEDDDVACEGQPASGQSEDESPPAEAPAPESPAPVAEAPAPSSAAVADVPADVMARVEGCAVIAISPHNLVGAGCPGVGVVTYHVPDGAPLMEGTVIMNPGAAQAAEAVRAPESSAATGGNGSTRNDDTAERAQNAAKADDGKDRATKQQSADDTKANKAKAKSKKQDRDGKNKNKNKNKNKKGGKGKKDNDKKGGKNNGKKGKK